MNTKDLLKMALSPDPLVWRQCFELSGCSMKKIEAVVNLYWQLLINGEDDEQAPIIPAPKIIGFPDPGFFDRTYGGRKYNSLNYGVIYDGKNFVYDSEVCYIYNAPFGTKFSSSFKCTTTSNYGAELVIENNLLDSHLLTYKSPNNVCDYTYDDSISFFYDQDYADTIKHINEYYSSRYNKMIQPRNESYLIDYFEKRKPGWTKYMVQKAIDQGQIFRYENKLSLMDVDDREKLLRLSLSPDETAWPLAVGLAKLDFDSFGPIIQRYWENVMNGKYEVKFEKESDCLLYTVPAPFNYKYQFLIEIEDYMLCCQCRILDQFASIVSAPKAQVCYFPDAKKALERLTEDSDDPMDYFANAVQHIDQDVILKQLQQCRPYWDQTFIYTSNFHHNK